MPASDHRIFISYRRDDDPFAARIIYDRLVRHFGDANVFFDVDSIPIGVDFVEYLDSEVQKCSAFIAVIGRGWVDASDPVGNRRLDNENDFVRIEIESALTRDMLVVPVLVNGADMPGAQELPESIRPLSRRNALSVSHLRFEADADGMARALEKALDDKVKRAREAEEAQIAEEARKAEDARRRKLRAPLKRSAWPMRPAKLKQRPAGQKRSADKKRSARRRRN